MLKSIFIITLLSISKICYSDTIVFNNFTQTYSYGNSGVVIGGPSDGSYFDEFAMSFTPTTTGYVSDIYFAFSTLHGTTDDSFNLWLSTDNNGLPSAQETSINFSVSSSSETLFSSNLIHLNATGSYLLDKNKTYWLGVNSPKQGVIGAWWSSLQGQSTTVAERNIVQSEQWAIEPNYSSAAFSISVTPVPAPAAIWLFLSGLLTIGFKFKKRKNMKNIIIGLLISASLTSCMLVQPKKYTYPEMVQVNVYDNSRWSSGTGGGDANQFITESTPKGQSIYNWKELITLQYYSKSIGNHSITQRLKEKESLLAKTCPTINFNILSQSDTEALYQWSIKGCDDYDDEFEVARYIKTENGIHRVSYSQKNSDPTQKDFDRWLHIVNDARVIKI